MTTPGETTTRWIARIPSIRSSEKYCRVEVEGAHIEDEPVALVREARLAVVIAALPDLVDALNATLLFHSGSPWDETKRSDWLHLTRTPEGTTKNLCDAIRAALAKMEGR